MNFCEPKSCYEGLCKTKKYAECCYYKGSSEEEDYNPQTLIYNCISLSDIKILEDEKMYRKCFNIDAVTAKLKEKT